ncbi:MAG: PIG-L family deacetylase [Burkholderiales bacterium]|nr:PIG-L family deacetylase [Burkholderiales bacterium]
MKKILFLFAHQDDEMSALPLIDKHIINCDDVYIFFVTSGTFDGETSIIRNNESSLCLTKIGVKAKNIFFIGSRHKICDKQLANELERARHVLHEELAPIGHFDKVYALAWEGGHADHDAVNLLAHDIVLNYQFVSDKKVYQIYFYNAYIPCGLVRIRLLFNPILLRNIKKYNFNFKQGAKYFGSLFIYKSQSYSLCWMLHSFFYRFLIKRNLYVVVANVRDVFSRPHAGPLNYERGGFYNYEDFDKSSQKFIKKYLQA